MEQTVEQHIMADFPSIYDEVLACFWFACEIIDVKLTNIADLGKAGRLWIWYGNW